MVFTLDLVCCKEPATPDNTIQCNTCSRWFHRHCAAVPEEYDNHYMCLSCGGSVGDGDGDGAADNAIDDAVELLAGLNLNNNKNTGTHNYNTPCSTTRPANNSSMTTPATNDVISPQNLQKMYNDAVSMLRESRQYQLNARREIEQSVNQLSELVASVNAIQRMLATNVASQSTSHASHTSPTDLSTANGFVITSLNRRPTAHHDQPQAAQSRPDQPHPAHVQSSHSHPVQMQPERSQPCQQQYCCSSQTIEPLPQFNGSDAESWLRFEATFRYQTRTGLNPDQLISNLSTALQGEAYDLVADQLIWRDDPQQILASLREVYGDSDKVIDRLAKKIVNSKPVRELPKHQLRQFAITVKRYVSNSNYFGRQDQLSSVFLERTIVSKLRDEHKDQWCVLKRRDPTRNIEDLSAFLMERSNDYSAEPPMESTSRLQQGKPSANTLSLGFIDFPNDSNQSYHDDTIKHVVGNISGTVRDNRGLASNHELNKRCFDCGEPHSIVNCRAFINRTVQERLSVARSKRVCTLCLATSDHSSEDCDRPRTCKFDGCATIHHWLLHNVNTITSRR